MVIPSGSPIDVKLRQYIETTYSPIPRDDKEKLIDALLTLTEVAADKKQSLHAFLEHVAKTIFRHFSIDEIAIGLYDRRTNTYFMDVVFGYRPEVGAEYLKMRYDYEDMVSQERFPYIKVGKMSEYAPVEGLPEEERSLLSRPYAGSLARSNDDDFHEGDYIDVWMYSPQKTILGWIELSKPRSGKMPPRSAIRWIEVIASICTFAIKLKSPSGDPAGR